MPKIRGNIGSRPKKLCDWLHRTPSYVNLRNGGKPQSRLVWVLLVPPLRDATYKTTRKSLRCEKTRSLRNGRKHLWPGKWKSLQLSAVLSLYGLVENTRPRRLDVSELIKKCVSSLIHCQDRRLVVEQSPLCISVVGLFRHFVSYLFLQVKQCR